MTLLRGLEVEELSAPTSPASGNTSSRRWKMGQLSREAFMREIAAMTERMVKRPGIRPRHHPRRLRHPLRALPQLRRRGEGKLPPLRLRRPVRTTSGAGAGGNSGQACGSRSRKSPPTGLKQRKPSSCWRTSASGPLEGSAPRPVGRSRPRSPSASTRSRTTTGSSIRLRRRQERRGHRRTGGVCRRVLGPHLRLGRARARQQLRLHARRAHGGHQPTPSCDFKSGKVILQQPWNARRWKSSPTSKTGPARQVCEHAHATARSNAFRSGTRTPGKVNFEFEQRESKFPRARPLPDAATKTIAASAAKKALQPKAPKSPKPRPPRPRAKRARQPQAPSAALAAVIGAEPVSRPRPVKKLWDYIKAQGLQDPKDKRTIRPTPSSRPCWASPRSACSSWPVCWGRTWADPCAARVNAPGPPWPWPWPLRPGCVVDRRPKWLPAGPWLGAPGAAPPPRPRQPAAAAPVCRSHRKPQRRRRLGPPRRRRANARSTAAPSADQPLPQRQCRKPLEGSLAVLPRRSSAAWGIAPARHTGFIRGHHGGDAFLDA